MPGIQAKTPTVSPLGLPAATAGSVNVDTIPVQCQNRRMKQIGAAEFKQQCLAILNRLGPEGVVITKHGKPVARVIPIGADSVSLIGSLRAKLTIKGDILTTGARWDAES